MRKRLKVFLFVPFILNKEIHFVEKFIFYLFWRERSLSVIALYVITLFVSLILSIQTAHLKLAPEFISGLTELLLSRGVRAEIGNILETFPHFETRQRLIFY